MSQTLPSLLDQFATLRDVVDARLEGYLELDSDCPDRLREAMRYSLLGGGKRLRPVLLLLACDACGGDQGVALPGACAIEMVHTYSLIHDDLPAMDDDDLRRGRPSNHCQFDEATAILAGDALLTLAFQVVAEEVVPPQVAAGCLADLASAAGACGMVGGQMADLAAEYRGIESVEELEQIHCRKTGRLLASAVTIGARIAGAEPEQLTRLRKYGLSVGLAFQIADDLLDVTGDRERMGKDVQKDAEHGKLTYPGRLGIEGSRAKAQELINSAEAVLAPFGERANYLKALARFVLERDH